MTYPRVRFHMNTNSIEFMDTGMVVTERFSTKLWRDISVADDGTKVVGDFIHGEVECDYYTGPVALVD